MTGKETIEKYRAALEKIAALENMKEIRGPFEDTGFPEGMIKEGGWVPIHPTMERAFRYAAKIAKEALK